jgi:hypothetical protein
MTWAEWLKQAPWINWGAYDTRSLLWIIYGRVESVAQTALSNSSVIQQLAMKVDTLMKTAADIKTAEQAEGEKINKLITLANSIYDKLQASSVVQDPAVQDVLDMIDQHNAAMDAATKRDTAPDQSNTPTG